MYIRSKTTINEDSAFTFLTMHLKPYGCVSSEDDTLVGTDSDASDGPKLPMFALTIDVSTESTAAVPETVSACDQSTLRRVDAFVAKTATSACANVFTARSSTATRNAVVNIFLLINL